MSPRFSAPMRAVPGPRRLMGPGTVALLLCAMLIALTACGGSGASAKPKPTRTQVPTGAVNVVKTLLDPALYSAAGSSKNPCAQSEPPYLTLDCPITTHLRAAIFRNYEYQRQFHGGYDPVCRCQGPPLHTTYHVPVVTSRFARVVAVRKYYGGYSHLTFIVLHTKNGWQADDIYCAGEIRGSVDNTPALTSCSLQRS